MTSCTRARHLPEMATHCFEGSSPQKNFFQTWGGRSHNYCGVLRFSIVRNVKNFTTVANLFDSSFNVFSKCIVIVIVFVLAFEGVL